MNEAVSRPEVEKPSLSDKIDNIVTHRIFGIPIFLVVMYLIFQITFSVGAPFQELLAEGFNLLGEFIIVVLGPHWYTSFIVDGIIGGVGSG